MNDRLAIVPSSCESTRQGGRGRQRKQECGIRTALGATPARHQTLGLALGALAATGAGRLATGVPVDVRPGDPVVFAVVGFLLGGNGSGCLSRVVTARGEGRAARDAASRLRRLSWKQVSQEESGARGRRTSSGRFSRRRGAPAASTAAAVAPHLPARPLRGVRARIVGFSDTVFMGNAASGPGSRGGGRRVRPRGAGHEAARDPPNVFEHSPGLSWYQPSTNGSRGRKF